MKKEEILHQQVVNYLKLQYPTMLFRTDFAAGLRLSLGQAVKHQRLQACKGWPDLFITEPSGRYAGLFIELKAEGAAVYRKDGGLLNDTHLQEQADVLLKLEERGYQAVFAIGFEQAKKVIDTYFNKKQERQL